MYKNLLCLASIVLVFSLTAEVSDGQEVYEFDGGGDGTTWGTAMTDLQVAMAGALPGDQIWVAAGTYRTLSRPHASVKHADPAHAVNDNPGHPGPGTARPDQPEGGSGGPVVGGGLLGLAVARRQTSTRP